MSRFAAAALSAVALSIALSGVAAADSSYGTHGHYKFIDTSDTPGAACRYSEVVPSDWRISSIMVKAPSVWWPNRNSGITTEHGRVGWRAIIKHMPADTWVTLKKTAIQYRTAYEDQLSPYGNSTKATFTNMLVSINGAALPQNDLLRVTVKTFWFRTDGSVLGWLTHDVYWYRVRLGTFNWVTAEKYCTRMVYLN